MTTRQLVSGLCQSALVMMVVATAFAQPAQPPAAAPPPIPKSPEIHADKTVTFRLSAPHSAPAPTDIPRRVRPRRWRGRVAPMS